MRTTIAAALAVCGVLSIPAYQAQQVLQKAVPGAKAGTVIETLDGSMLYSTYCAVCHGPKGKGDGPMAKLLLDKPPDLTHISAKHAAKFPRVEVDAIIAGEADVAGHGTREMPIWGPVFSRVSRDTDMGRVRVDNVSRYLESLQQK